MEENKTSIGSIISVIIVIALIVLGGLYFWGKRIEESKNTEKLSNETVQQTDEVEQEATTIRSTGSSDELNSIENDLNNTNLINLDADLSVELQ